MRYPNNLSEVLARLNISQSEAGIRSGIQPGHINRIARGFLEPRVGTGVRLAQAIGVPTEDIFPATQKMVYATSKATDVPSENGSES